MNEEDRKPFGLALTRLFAIYGERCTEAVIEAWWGALAPRYAMERVLDGMNAHAQDPDAGMYKPTPAHVIRHLDGRSGERALLAWAKVLGAIRSAGQNYTLVFDDWRIHAAITHMGGWPRVASCLESDLPHIERRFVAAYGALVTKKAAQIGFPPRLVGVLDVGADTVRYIGDPERCKRIEGTPPAPPAFQLERPSHG